MRYGHRKWRGHPYALNLRGEPRKLEPLLSNKNAPRHKRVHSIIQIVREASFRWLFPCFIFRPFQIKFPRLLQFSAKYKLMHLRLRISPPSHRKDKNKN